MINYENGKIYKIEPICEHEPSDIYIGSTTKKYLSDRMSEHRCDFRRSEKTKKVVNSSILFQKYGVENCKIILIEKFSCESKDELVAKEAEYIRTVPCINKVIPQRSKQEYDKMYSEKNREKKKAYERSEERKEQRKKFEKSEARMEYRKIWGNQIIVCDCGCEIKKSELSRHKKSQKHQNLINQN